MRLVLNKLSFFMLKYFFIVFLSVWSYMAVAAPLPITHEFHLSRCMIEYNEPEKSLQITLHIFIDDLEAALAEQGAKELFIATEKEAPDSDKYIERYLNQRFNLNVNQNEATYTYLGKEISEDLSAIWCYLEVNEVNFLQELLVDYNVLMEIYDDQKNIINIVGPNKKEAYFLFIKGNTKDSIKF